MKINFYGFDLLKIISNCNVQDPDDLDLISKYSYLKPSDWVYIDKNQAKTNECRDCLRKMINILYHREEFLAGML